MFDLIIDFGTSFAEGLKDVYEWFYTPNTVSYLLYQFASFFVSPDTWWSQKFLEKIGDVDIGAFVPADLIFGVGLPALLGIIVVRWIIETFL